MINYERVKKYLAYNNNQVFQLNVEVFFILFIVQKKKITSLSSVMEEMKNYYYFCITLCLAEFAIKTENYNIQIKKNIYIQKKNTQIYFVSKLHINCVTIWRFIEFLYYSTKKKYKNGSIYNSLTEIEFP